MYVNVENVLTIAFKLTIFFLLCAQMVELFSTYALPGILQQIRKNRTYRENLTKKRELLKKTQKRVQEELRGQETALAQLEIKIAQWHTAQKAKVDARRRTQEQLVTKIEHKNEVRTQNLHLHKVQQEVIPKAIIHAQELLLGESAPKNSRELLHELIMHLGTKTKTARLQE